MTGAPKPCTVCGVRPPAMREIPYCFTCWPGGPVTAPPCRKCGSTTDYYTSGLCARCHPHAPGEKSPVWNLTGPLAQRRVVTDSCPDCHAWGVTRTYGWVCVGCRSWRERYHQVQPCVTCGQSVSVNDTGSCRLCHKQRSMVAHATGQRFDHVSLADANRHGQQLFLAGMWHTEGHGKRPYLKKTVPPDMTRLRPVGYRQLVLFEAHRDLRLGMLHGFPPPPDPALEAALTMFVTDYAARHRWPKTKADRSRRAIRILLGIQDTPGAPIRRSDVALLSRIKHSAAVVADVLAEAGMLEEDREPVIVRWYTNATNTLPTRMREELGIWLNVMRNGSTTPPRRRPRADDTIRIQLSWSMPTLKAWVAQGHDSLREIGRDDVLAVLPTDKLGRYTTLQGLRSLFGILKGRKVVFVNPTRRIDNPQPELRSPTAVDLDVLRSDLDSERPATAALAALLAFHAIPIVHIRQLRLTDVHDGRVRVGGQVIPLAEPARRRLSAYLDYRQQSWPESINPYLFTHARSWWLDQAVSPQWIRDQLSLPAQSIRFDRILDEAHATGGDIRRLMDLFGISVETAYRYVKTVNTAAGAPVE